MSGEENSGFSFEPETPSDEVKHYKVKFPVSNSIMSELTIQWPSFRQKLAHFNSFGTASGQNASGFGYSIEGAKSSLEPIEETVTPGKYPVSLFPFQFNPIYSKQSHFFPELVKCALSIP